MRTSNQALTRVPPALNYNRSERSGFLACISSCWRVTGHTLTRLEEDASMRLPLYIRGANERLDRLASNQATRTRLSHKQLLPFLAGLGGIFLLAQWRLFSQFSDQTGCLIPTGYGGWHGGTFVAILTNEDGWSWKACAAACASDEACEFWTLPLIENGKDTKCHLKSNKGQYHETGYQLEGNKDLNCLNPDAPVAGQEIKSIYYINLQKNKLRRQFMEQQLAKQDIPFHRVDALAGNQNHTCSGGVSEAKCRGVAGVALSNLEIIDHGDHSKGFSLVLEDDIYVNDMAILMASIGSVPKDWDIIRWNCIPEQYIPATFERINKYVFRTRHAKPCEPTPQNLMCNFYGGAYTMLWRNSSLDKLRAIWSVEPFNDIDGRLTTDQLNSYCVDVGKQVVHQPPAQEMSDIQLDENGTVNVKWGS